jgi:holo-[acyl-carrier protein] synthase
VIVGVGVDIVDVGRFAAVLARTPRVADRLFTPRERERADGTALDPRSLAARFASKEAVAKALGVPAGMAWHDCEVIAHQSGRPVLELTWTVAAAAAELGATAWHLSISHDGGLAVAYVVAEAT